MKTIYLVAAATDGGFRSYARDEQDPRRIAAWATAKAAAFAASVGEPFIPGFFIGAESVEALTSIPLAEVKGRLAGSGDGVHFEGFYDFTGAERVVHAYRSRARAEAVARSLSEHDECRVDPCEGTDQNHVVVEAIVEEPEDESWQRPTSTRAAAWIAGFSNPDDYHPLMET